MTPRTEWNELISRSRNLTCAVSMMVLSAAILTVSAGVLFCSVFTTVFRVFRGAVDRTMMKIAMPELLQSDPSDNAGYAASPAPQPLLCGPVTAVREGFQLVPTVQRPSATPMAR